MNATVRLFQCIYRVQSVCHQTRRNLIIVACKDDSLQVDFLLTENIEFHLNK